MFLKILKKDLMRKKIMTIVLLLFIIISSTLIASSISQIYFTTGVIDEFLETSKTADFTTWLPYSEAINSKAKQWAAGQDSIKSATIQKQLNISIKDVTLPKDCDKIPDGTLLMLGEISKNINLVFDQSDKALDLKDGEIGIPMDIKEKTGLKLGDSVELKIGSASKTFKVAYIVKDALLGSTMNVMKNIFISTKDFEELVSKATPENIYSCVTFLAKDQTSKTSIEQLYSQSGLPATGLLMDKSTVKLSYSASYGVMAALLFAVSLILLLVAFLTLRFTITSTLQDDYKQIGILKAIGLKSHHIRKIYLLKYLFISLLGGMVGFLLSIPLTNVLAGQLVSYMVMSKKAISLPIAALSIMLVIIIVLLVCFLTMRKINKCSPIDAIRQGNTGERFKPSGHLFLHRRKAMNSLLFLAISDIFNNLKHYSSLIITFILCISIIIIPVNVNSTISNTEFLDAMGKTKGDIYIEGEKEIIPMERLTADFNRIKQKFANNHEPIDFYVEYYCTGKYSSDVNGYSTQLLAVKLALPTDKYKYLSGTGPKLENEIAVSKTLLKQTGKNVGDYIDIEINDIKRNFLISGSFENMLNMQNVIRVSEAFKSDKLAMYSFVGVINTSTEEKSKLVQKIINRYPDLKMKNEEEILKETTSSFSTQLDSLVIVIIITVSIILFFITSLFVRLLLAKEYQSIALLKSIGLTNKQLRLWQVYRILIIMLFSIITGTLMANLLGEKLLGLVFNGFGIGKLTFIISPIQVYVICPCILAIIALIAVLTSCQEIKTIQVYNINEE